MRYFGREYWTARYAEMEKRIPRMRAEADIAGDPRYRMEIEESADAIVLRRDIYSLKFSKKTASVTHATINGTELPACRLPHVVIVAADGTEYRQENAADGSLAISEEKFFINLTGGCTLTAGRGRPAIPMSVRYALDRMFGLTTCDLSFPSWPKGMKIKRLTVENTLGPTDPHSDIAYTPHTFRTRWAPYRDGILKSDKATMAAWHNGRLGLQVFPVTWEVALVSDEGTRALPWWIHPPGKLMQPNYTFYARRSLDLPAEPNRAWIAAASDDKGTLYVNGVEVGPAGGYTYADRYDILPRLRKGRNVIAATVSNKAYECTFILNGETELADGTVVPIRSNPDWRVADVEAQGWTTAEFDDRAWQHAEAYQPLCQGPWGMLDKMPFPDLGAMNERFVTMRVADGASHINLTPINVGSGEPVAVDPAWHFRWTYSLMPFRRYVPKCVIFASASGTPGVAADPAGDSTGFVGITDDTEKHIALLASLGTNLLVAFGDNHGNGDPASVEASVAFRDLCHKYGIKVITYIERSLFNKPRAIRRGMFTEEQITAAQQVIRSQFGGDGIPKWGDEVPMCINDPNFRLFCLAMYSIYFDDLGVDGLYLDSAFIPSCENTRHGESAQESTGILGALEFHQNLRLLLDDQREDKIYLNHYWDQLAAPVLAQADFTMPGEQITAQNRRHLEHEELWYGFSSLSAGVQSIWYTAKSFDYAHPGMYNDAMKACAIPFVEINRADDPSPETRLAAALYRKFVLPLAIFDTTGATVHHPFLPGYDKVVKAEPARTTVAVVYEKPYGCLLTIAGDMATWASVRVHQSVVKGDGDIVAFSATKRDLVPIQRDGDWLVIPRHDLSTGPELIFLRRVSAVPTVLWRDWELRGIREESWNPTACTLTIKAWGPPNQSGSVFVYSRGDFVPADEPRTHRETLREHQLRLGPDGTGQILLRYAR